MDKLSIEEVINLKSIVKQSISFTLIILSLLSMFSISLVKANELNKIILIDPGHGGFDGGAISKNGTVEKDINLAICLKLRKHLKECGFQVIMTREIDKDLSSINHKAGHRKQEDLNNRCKLKEDSNCDLFISIHQNMFPERDCKGAQIWYSKTEASKLLAEILKDKLKEKVDSSNNRVAKVSKEGYKILRCDSVPSVLVECGFLSNPGDEQKLKDDAYQESLAMALAEGVKEFYQSIKG